jgi:hypothetical protein
MMNPQTFIYLSRPRPGVVDMALYTERTFSRLLGQLFLPFRLRDEYDWCSPSYQGSPDIGDEPDDQRP